MTKLSRYYLDMPSDWGEAFEAGDLLIGPRACQVVVEAWPTETDRAPNRWTLTIRRLGPRPSSPSEWAAFRGHGRPGAREVHHVPRSRGSR